MSIVYSPIGIMQIEKAMHSYRSVFFVGTNDSYSPTKAPTKEVVNIISAYLVLSIQLTVFTRIKGMD